MSVLIYKETIIGKLIHCRKNRTQCLLDVSISFVNTLRLNRYLKTEK